MTSADNHGRFQTVRRSLGLVPSTDTSMRPIGAFGQESKKIGQFDEQTARLVNDVAYHKHNGLADFTYDNMSGMYREAKKKTYF